MKIISLTFLLSSLLVLSCSVHKSYGSSKKEIIETLIQALLEKEINAEHKSIVRNNICTDSLMLCILIGDLQDLVDAQLFARSDYNWHSGGQLLLKYYDF